MMINSSAHFNPHGGVLGPWFLCWSHQILKCYVSAFFSDCLASLVNFWLEIELILFFLLFLISMKLFDHFELLSILEKSMFWKLKFLSLMLLVLLDCHFLKRNFVHLHFLNKFFPLHVLLDPFLVKTRSNTIKLMSYRRPLAGEFRCFLIFIRLLLLIIFYLLLL